MRQGFVNNVGAIFQGDANTDGVVGVALHKGAFSAGNSWRGDSESVSHVWKLATELEQIHGKSPSPCQDSREATSSEEPTSDTFRHHSMVSSSFPLQTCHQVIMDHRC